MMPSYRTIDPIANARLPLVESVYCFVENNYSAPISLLDVADAVGYSAAHLTGAFENLAPHSAARIDVSQDRLPVPLISGGDDHLVPTDYTLSNAKLISKSPAVTPFKDFAGRPHFTVAVPG
jgi:hypothetical protein